MLAYLNGAFALTVWVICRISKACPVVETSVNFGGLNKNFSSCSQGFAENQFLLIGIIWIVLGYGLYILSIPVAKTIGLLIRTSYDLYRFDLFKQLNHPIPKTLSQERKYWAKISDFIVTGGKLGVEPLEFNYSLRPEFLIEEKENKGWLEKLFNKFRFSHLRA